MVTALSTPVRSDGRHFGDLRNRATDASLDPLFERQHRDWARFAGTHQPKVHDAFDFVVTEELDVPSICVERRTDLVKDL